MAGRSKAGKAKQKAGRKLDALLFGIPENRAKFMRTGKTNPAPKKRALYRLGYAAGKRNPANPGDALVSVERTVVFREAAVGGLEDARSFFLAGYADGAGEKRNPYPGEDNSKFRTDKQEAAIKRVKESASRTLPSVTGPRESVKGIKFIGERSDAGGSVHLDYEVTAVGPYRGGDPAAHTVIVTFTIGRSGGILRTRKVANPSRRKTKKVGKKDEGMWRSVLGSPRPGNYSGKRSRSRQTHEYRGGGTEAMRDAGRFPRLRNPRNPADTAQAAFEGFHGEKSKKTIVVQERRHFHTHVWALGPLVLLKVKLPSDRRQAGLKNIVEIEFDYEGKNPVFVTANEKRNQMFFDGGDQSVNVKTFGVPPEPHEKVVLGEVSDAWYFTTKKHLGKDGGTAIYKHKLGEEGGELPTLLYHTIDKRLELAGGSYTIPNEGVRN